MKLLFPSFVVLFLNPWSLAGERRDIQVADFEGKDYGAWKTTGTAFGKGPVRGLLPNQMQVSGYLGLGLVNSYLGGDDAKGTLTSPAFKVERKYINFLIGGGKYPGETCINLLVNGKVVRTATGPNDKPGGTERLEWHAWDVAELAGKEAVIEIVDQRAGGWGHINIDHIVQSDRRRQIGPVHRNIVVGKRYLTLPVQMGAALRRVRFEIDGKTVREFEIELAEGKTDYTVESDVGPWIGKKLRIATVLVEDSKALEAIGELDALPGPAISYADKLRPQFHFTARRGWLNDPNGLVYLDGEYHLFFQHNPYGINWGNMHWGHAVSKDLVHWQELPIALYPRQFGDWCFSGSAVIDHENMSGFKKGRTPVMVAAFTSTGRGECIVYSNDKGRTWTEYEGNPVVKHQGRDPKLLWHEPSKRWVMAVYDEEDKGKAIAFYSSPDLKKWTYESKIDGFYECPDLFELPLDGDANLKRWILYAADGKYFVGDFDGRRFTPTSKKLQLWHGRFYAAQTFSNAPDHRRIQIGWASGISHHFMPFNQQMTVPVELRLGSTVDGPRMYAYPVKELKALRAKEHRIDKKPATNPYKVVGNDPFEYLCEFDPSGTDVVRFFIRGVELKYNVKEQKLRWQGVAAPLQPLLDRIRLRILVDRASVEVFGNDGIVALSLSGLPAKSKDPFGISPGGGSVRFQREELYTLRSAWEKR